MHFFLWDWSSLLSVSWPWWSTMSSIVCAQLWCWTCRSWWPRLSGWSSLLSAFLSRLLTIPFIFSVSHWFILRKDFFIQVSLLHSITIQQLLIVYLIILFPLNLIYHEIFNFLSLTLLCKFLEFLITLFFQELLFVDVLTFIIFILKWFFLLRMVHQLHALCWTTHLFLAFILMSTVFEIVLGLNFCFVIMESNSFYYLFLFHFAWWYYLIW